MKKSRNHEFSDKTGSYRIIASLGEDIIDPSNSVDISIRISGYGQIHCASFLYYPSFGLFDESNSFIKVGLSKLENDLLVFDAPEQKISKDGAFINLFGIKDMGDQSIFIDDPEVPKRIITETSQGGNPVIKIRFKTRKDIKSGQYSVKFILKYFNGEKWETNVETVYFTVTSFFDRSQVTIALVGLLLALISISPLLFAFLSEYIFCSFFQ